jgi:hypothetical protein
MSQSEPDGLAGSHCESNARGRSVELEGRWHGQDQHVAAAASNESAFQGARSG